MLMEYSCNKHNMERNSIVRLFSFGTALLLFFDFTGVHLMEAPANPLTEQAQAQMKDIQYLSQLFLRDLNWVKRDLTEGVVHWSYADFIKGLQILEQKWKGQKPTCFDSTDGTKEGLKKVVTEAETCLKQLEDTVQEAGTSAGLVKTLEEADNVVTSMLAYKSSRNEKIEECKKIATKMMPLYDSEKKKIEKCVNQ